jgi:glycosyltransferase involved in cell wall biosynthesis
MRSLGVATFALGARSRRAYPVALARLVGVLRRSRAEVVQTHLLDGSLVGLAAARLARAPQAVMTAHHSHELPFHGRRLLWPERLCAGPMCDHIIAPSRQVAATLGRLAHVPDEKISIVHHGFDLKRLDPHSVDEARVRRELGLEGRLVVGAIGRIYWIKNYPALLEAFASALSETPEARLLIVGPGEPAQLRALAGALGIGDRVLLCGARSDIPDVLAAMDLFVHPALAESFGMAIIEAMAMAKPVLTTRVGIAPEVVRDGVTGVFSRGGNSADLAVGLRSMLALRARWQTLGAAARREVSGFTAANMGRRYAELYDAWLDEATALRAR